jgi:putative Mn2+ efflux pump MntP
MSIFSTTVMAFSMSADAFAVSIAKGIKLPNTRLREALRIGALFGLVEGVTPLIGWMLGVAASGFIQAIDHWIAFTILSLVGGKMIYESLRTAPPEDARPAEPYKAGRLLLTAVGTSLDAMAIGVTLAFLNVNILLVSGVIGLATFLMVTLGVLAGQFLGAKMGRLAETLGGLGLLFIGTKILFEHLGYV